MCLLFESLLIFFNYCCFALFLLFDYCFCALVVALSFVMSSFTVSMSLKYLSCFSITKWSVNWWACDLLVVCWFWTSASVGNLLLILQWPSHVSCLTYTLQLLNLCSSVPCTNGSESSHCTVTVDHVDKKVIFLWISTFSVVWSCVVINAEWLLSSHLVGFLLNLSSIPLDGLLNRGMGVW